MVSITLGITVPSPRVLQPVQLVSRARTNIAKRSESNQSHGFLSGLMSTQSCSDRLDTRRACSHYVLIDSLVETSKVNGWDGNDSHHPPCRPGCLLCFGR